MRSCCRIDAHDLRGVHRAAPVGDEGRARPTRRDGEVGVHAARRRDGQRRLTALRRHDVDLLEARVLGGQIDLLTVGRERPALHRSIERLRDDRRLARPRPRPHRQPVERVDLLLAGARDEVERTAVRAEPRVVVRRQVVRQLLRFAARRGNLIQMRVHRGIGRRVLVRRRGEDDGGAVGRPHGVELFARVEPAPAVAGALHELRAGEEIARFAARLERLHEHVDLTIVEPAIPVTDGEAVVTPAPCTSDPCAPRRFSCLPSRRRRPGRRDS